MSYPPDACSIDLKGSNWGACGAPDLGQISDRWMDHQESGLSLSRCTRTLHGERTNETQPPWRLHVSPLIGTLTRTRPAGRCQEGACYATGMHARVVQ
jgi:hypothetical protein